MENENIIYWNNNNINNNSLDELSSNSNHQHHHNIPYSDRPETYIIPVIFAIIFLIGVLGNGTLILIFIRHRIMRNVPNTYILSLALGDLLVIISCVPFTSTVYTVDTWPYGELICKISEATKDISIGVSVFTLTALSADRFFAIVDPLNKLHSSIGKRGTKLTIIVVVFIWFISIIFAIPAATLSYIRVFKEDNVTLFEACYPYPEEWSPLYPKTVVIIKFLLYYAIPLIIIGFFYILMARHLLLSTRNMPGEIQQGQGRQIRARKKVARTVLAFVLVFAVCFFPQHVFMLWFYNNPTASEDYNEFWHIFRMMGFCLAFINSCVNPIALYFVSGAFRKYFDNYLFRLCRKKVKPHRRQLQMSRSRRGTRRTLFESSITPAIQLSTFRKIDNVNNTECTVTTLINGIDRNQIL